MKKICFCFFLVSALLLISCSTLVQKKNLDPDSKEFLNLVRYLITSQEKRIFLNLPPSERPGFIEEFWKKRDPDPETENNEFQEEYFQRIEEANLLFKEGTTPGWLQDRGRVYITLGPPDSRETYPRGRSLYGFPEEIWWYNFFPIYFRDNNWTSNYRLDPFSAQHINEINRAQSDFGPKVPREGIVFDFKLGVENRNEEGVVFQIVIPYKNIWFAQKKNLLLTNLAVTAEVFDQDERKIWQFKEVFEVSVEEEELPDLINSNYRIEIPAEFEAGDYTLVLEIENKTGEKRVQKRENFSVGRF